MGVMNKERRVQVLGRMMAALAMMVVPVVAGAAVGGARVHVTRSAPGHVVLEVADGKVVVRKEIAADQSIVTMATPTDRLVLTVRRDKLSISGSGGVMSLVAPGGRDYDRFLALLNGSEAAALARELLSQVTDGPETFVGQSLLLTRAILDAGTGHTGALQTYQRWVSERASALAVARPTPVQGGPRLIRTSGGGDDWQRGPGDCWELYAEEAIRIADDFADCTSDLEWYEVHKWAGCSLIYVMRSEGAMAWFISCNGGIPFRG